jgi:hypothetical protein
MDPSLISPKTLDDARFAFENAIEALGVAEFNAKKAVLDEKAAENLILELESRLDDARIKLQEHEVKAPLDGVISKRGIKGGETIGPRPSCSSSPTSTTSCATSRARSASCRCSPTRRRSCSRSTACRGPSSPGTST